MRLTHIENATLLVSLLNRLIEEFKLIAELIKKIIIRVITILKANIIGVKCGELCVSNDVVVLGADLHSEAREKWVVTKEDTL